MLILSKEYIDAHSNGMTAAPGRPITARKAIPTAIPMCKMNLILHGIMDADIKMGDVLTDPAHKESGELIRFDRVSWPIRRFRWTTLSPT